MGRGREKEKEDEGRSEEPYGVSPNCLMYLPWSQGKAAGVAQKTLKNVLSRPRSGNASGMCCCRSMYRQLRRGLTVYTY